MSLHFRNQHSETIKYCDVLYAELRYLIRQLLTEVFGDAQTAMLKCLVCHFLNCDSGFTKKRQFATCRYQGLYTGILYTYAWVQKASKALSKTHRNIRRTQMLLMRGTEALGPARGWMRMGEKSAVPWHDSLPLCSKSSKVVEVSVNPLVGQDTFTCEEGVLLPQKPLQQRLLLWTEM